MIGALLAILLLIGTFLVTAGSSGLRRLSSSHAERQLRRRLGVSHRIYKAAFDRRATQGAILTAQFATHCLRFAATVASILFLISLDGWPIHGTTILAAAGEILLLLAILLWIDLTAQSWAHAHPERAIAFSAPLLGFCLVGLILITYPILRGSRLLRPTSSHMQLREELAVWLDELEAAGAIDRSSKQLLEAAATFHQRLVREVMISRSHIFALPAEMSLRQATQELLREEYSRVPVFEGSLDKVTGILMHKDLLQRAVSQPEFGDEPIGKWTKKPLFVPETKAMGELLNELRRKRTHMAIVVDEYGSTAGLVTIEDLLEELVGDIADEYDIDEQEMLQPHPRGGWLVHARIPLAQLEDQLSIHIPQTGGFDTLGGYIVHQVGSIPPKGLRIQGEQFDLEILSCTDRSVELVRILPRPTEE
jgi:putative hemolysin